MLASECAWIVLRAEHARMRHILDRIDATLRAADWRQRETPAQLLELIERLWAFDEATHRPKGTVPLALLRGRSPAADALLDQLAQESERCESLLVEAKAALGLVASGNAGAVRTVETLLSEHGRVLRGHLECEDTLLHLQMDLLLTPEEWAIVVSEISNALEVGRRALGA